MLGKQFQEVKVTVPEIAVPGWLPMPSHFDPLDAGRVYNANAMEIVPAAREWGKQHSVPLASTDKVKVLLMIIDAQLTFCHPDFTLFVGGTSGIGAIEDNVRLSRLMYGAAPYITDIVATMDTHRVMAIFHESMIMDENGNHAPNVPPTAISYDDIVSGKWQIDPSMAYAVSGNAGAFMAMQHHLVDYTKQLKDKGRYNLIVWPYHAMLGSIEHALVPVIQEAMLWHHGLRRSRLDYEIKGGKTLFENYSILGPEINETHYPGWTPSDPRIIDHASKNTKFLQRLLEYDVIAVAGQAASHCVAFSIDDLLGEILAKDPKMAGKVHILQDCTSSVVVRDPAGNIIPGPYTDFRPAAEAKMKEFAAKGMHLVNSTDPIDKWPGYQAALQGK